MSPGMPPPRATRPDPSHPPVSRHPPDGLGGTRDPAPRPILGQQEGAANIRVNLLERGQETPRASRAYGPRHTSACGRGPGIVEGAGSPSHSASRSWPGQSVHHGRGAPVLGRHTREVLRENGYAEAEIDRLAAEGAILLG